MAASVLLVIAGWNAERDAAAAKPETEDEAEEEEEPGKTPWTLIHYSDPSSTALMAGDFSWMTGPDTWIGWVAIVRSHAVSYRLGLPCHSILWLLSIHLMLGILRLLSIGLWGCICRLLRWLLLL